MEKRDDPSNPSGAYTAMAPAWTMIDDIIEGHAQVRSKGETYLPKNPAETTDEYKRRLKMAPWSPEFADILNTLSAKPFGKEVSLKDGASGRIKTLAEDIDGKGNNLTAFARPVFRGGVAKGCQAILVDNTGRGTARTQAEERLAGVRPYWVAIRAEDIIDLKTAFVGGRELPYHVRVKECRVERDGYAEKEVQRIREMNRAPAFDDRGEIIALGPPTWKVHEKQAAQPGIEERWIVVQEGAFAPLTEIPLALFWTGERMGPQKCQPPLYDLANKQIELYRAQSRNEEAFYSVGYPMYSANGLSPPTGDDVVETGPNRIMYAPSPGASWEIISADADSLRVLLEDVEARTDTIRRLGMQPLTQKSGAITATASSVEAAKAHSTVQAWAIGFKDVLEQAFVYTSQWLGEQTKVEVSVHTDFMAGTTDQPSLDALDKARERKDISRRAYLEGLIRFSVLPADFDIEDDDELIAEEMQGLEPEDEPSGEVDPEEPREAA